ncbi:cytidine deaminase [Catenuloplanes nepalensis]|uniref:Cytidine deaminase n=2 Tax=Catenuloplanes nepalensis TaxID=587533 RepID=A0ABT9N2C0_9ACTN|nr:cytidine deaminase [Catenuloplanes nepalensis]
MTMEIDWAELRAAAVEVMQRAYAPYSRFPVGAAALVDDGRVIVGCNVENAGYGVALCAECGVVSQLHASGGGRIVALSCVDATGQPIMPCGRCRQLLWENGGPNCLIEAYPSPLLMAELMPHGFGPADLAVVTSSPAPSVPVRLSKWIGQGTVFIHPELDGGKQVWTGYWDRSSGAEESERAGILEEGPIWPDTEEGVRWGRARTPRVVVVDAEGAMSWAGEGDPPAAFNEGVPA